MIIGIIALLSFAWTITIFYLDTRDSTVQMLDFVVTCIIIYYIYFECTFQGMLKKETGEGRTPWGHFWLGGFTLGIYWIYWNYAAGKRLTKMGARDRSMFYLLVNIVSFVISITMMIFILVPAITFANNLIFVLVSAFSSLIPFATLIHMQCTANKIVDNRNNAGPVYGNHSKPKIWSTYDEKFQD